MPKRPSFYALLGLPRSATPEEIRRSRVDIVTGMFFSNLVMYFIIVTTAATLHAQGKTTIATAQDAAEALRPLAGDGPDRHAGRWAERGLSRRR